MTFLNYESQEENISISKPKDANFEHQAIDFSEKPEYNLENLRF